MSNNLMQEVELSDLEQIKLYLNCSNIVYAKIKVLIELKQKIEFENELNKQK